MAEKEKKNSNNPEDDETSKLFAEVKTTTKNIIDTIKNELVAEEVKQEWLDSDYKKQKITISTVIEEAIDIYQQLRSLSPETKELLEKYIKEYGSLAKVVEKTIILLDQKKHPEMDENLDLWCRAREEMHMMLIGKTTFNQLLTAAEAPEESLDKPMKRNLALDVILWYTGKQIKSLTLEEIIHAIKKVWRAANYFYFIDDKKIETDQYHLIFKHHQNKRYSNYWLGYFRELFQSDELSFKCAIEGEAFDETLSLTIKKLHDKKKKR
ncbi:MAG: hypothetical protein ACFFAO_18680 [Candidatus Hermodarchaeota archaeon]